MTLSKDIEENYKHFKNDFVDCSDFLVRKAKIEDKKLFFAACDGLIDSLQLSQMVVSPILKSEDISIDNIKNSITNCVELNEAKTFADCYYYIMSGFAIVVVDGENIALAFGIQNPPSRSVDEPTNEQSTKAPKEAFVEILNTNKALLRKRLKTPHLKLKQIKLASAAPAPCVIAYMDDRADKELVTQIISAVQNSKLNVLTDFGTLIPFVDTSVNSMFSDVASTERPDIIVSKLLEGRVAILVEGSPIALYTPALFSDNFQTPDDYNIPPFYSGFIRTLRYFSFVLCRNRNLSPRTHSYIYAFYYCKRGNNNPVFVNDRGTYASYFVRNNEGSRIALAKSCRPRSFNHRRYSYRRNYRVGWSYRCTYARCHRSDGNFILCCVISL